MHDIDIPIIDILAIHNDLTMDTTDINDIVHPVQAAQKGRLTATGRTDQRSHFVFHDVDINIKQCLLFTIENGDLAALHFRLARACAGGSLDGYFA